MTLVRENPARALDHTKSAIPSVSSLKETQHFVYYSYFKIETVQQGLAEEL